MCLNKYLSKEEENKQIYILRYYLPCEPVCDAETTARRSNELLDYCIRNRIQAVMLYVDLNPYWYYLPDNLEHTVYYIDVVADLGRRLRDAGVSYQLNYQNLFGSWDGGADMRHVNGWENYVDQYGVESWGCGCNLGTKFREIAGEKLRLWAETKPDIIWIDDDIRFHNHRTAMHKFCAGEVQNEELDFGCFCEKHITKFNEKYNLAVTREQIHQGILAGGDLRRMWLEFSRECANDVALWIEKTVYDVSPDTTVALMSSVPDVHSVEGRHWGEFLKGLSGDKTPIVRAHFGPYNESHPHEFYDSYNLIEQLKANIKFQYEGDFEFCPEIENTRFSVWSKSLSATAYQLMLSAFLGCKGVTLSIYDLEGGLLNEYPEFEKLLIETRPFCDEMAKEDLWNAESIGVGIVTASDRVGEETFKKGVPMMSSLANGRLWDKVLIKCGIPCKYVTPDEFDSEQIFAIDKFSAELLTDDEIRLLLSKSIILDAGAAECLQNRGFGDYIGVKVCEKITCIGGTEAYNDYTHKDGSEMRLPIRVMGGKWNNITLNGAVQMSRYITPYGREYTGTAIFENALGGKVIVFAGNGSLGDGFFSSYRIEYVKKLLSDMTDKSLPVIDNKSYALFAVKETEDKYMMFISNMSADVIDNIKINFPKEISACKLVSMNGDISVADVVDGTIELQNLKLDLYGVVACIADKKI